MKTPMYFDVFVFFFVSLLIHVPVSILVAQQKRWSTTACNKNCPHQKNRPIDRFSGKTQRKIPGRKRNMSWRPWPSFACWERCIWSLGMHPVAPRPDVILWHEYFKYVEIGRANEASANKNANRNMLETRCEPLKYALSISWIFQ